MCEKPVPEGTVSAEEVRRIAALIRLEVGDDEAEALGRHFQKILGHFARLRALDLGDLPPFTPGADHMLFREDVETSWEERGEVLAGAPFREGDFFRVPRLGCGEDPRERSGNDGDGTPEPPSGPGPRS